MQKFGMCIFGDSVTVLKTPMMNVLSCPSGNPNCVLVVVDCSSHAVKGEKKDACYVCQNMLWHMKKLDLMKTLCDRIALKKLEMGKKQEH
jgi:hypothetical protein